MTKNKKSKKPRIGRPPRGEGTHVVGIRFADSLFEEVVAASKKSGVLFAEFVRGAALWLARSDAATIKAASEFLPRIAAASVGGTSLTAHALARAVDGKGKAKVKAKKRPTAPRKPRAKEPSRASSPKSTKPSKAPKSRKATSADEFVEVPS